MSVTFYKHHSIHTKSGSGSESGFSRKPKSESEKCSRSPSPCPSLLCPRADITSHFIVFGTSLSFTVICCTPLFTFVLFRNRACQIL